MTNGNETTLKYTPTREDLDRLFAAQDADRAREAEARDRAAHWPYRMERVVVALSARVDALEAQLAVQAKA